MRRIVLAATAALIIGGPLMAEGEAPPPVPSWAQEDAKVGMHWRTPWLLGLAPSTPNPELDEQLLPLLVESDLRIIPIPNEVWEGLRKEKGRADGPYWLLLGPGGAVRQEGAGPVDPAKVLAALEGEGFIPTGRRRRAFLREHPHSGEAWMDEFKMGEALARGRFQAWTGMEPWDRKLRADPKAILDLWSRLDANKASSLFAEGRDALEHLAEVPGWGAGYELGPLRFNYLAGDPEARKAAAPLESKLWMEMESCDPTLPDSSSYHFWAFTAKTAGLDLLTKLKSLRELSGTTIRTNLIYWIRLLDPSPDPKVLLPFLEHLLEEPPHDWAVLHPALVFRNLAEGTFFKAELELRAGRPEVAASDLERVHRIAGSRWAEVSRLAEAILGMARVPLGTRITKILEAPPLPDPPPPAPAPALRLAVLEPTESSAWKALLSSETFAPWDGKELEMYQPGKSECVALRARIPDGASLRWVLLRKGEIIAKGGGLPKDRTLADVLESTAPSRLQRASAYLVKNPDHLGARKARLRLLLARMPNRWLEPLLAEDCLATGLPPVPRPAGWTPEPRLWQWAAEKALPEAERNLESWPRHAPYWKAWLGWSELHSRNPSPLGMAERVHPWPPNPGVGPSLPVEVHKTVAEELRRDARFEQLRAWMQAAWEGQDRRPWSALQKEGYNPKMMTYLREDRGAVKEAILDPYREALVTLRRDAEVVALDREIAAWLDGGTAK